MDLFTPSKFLAFFKWNTCLPSRSLQRRSLPVGVLNIYNCQWSFWGAPARALQLLYYMRQTSAHQTSLQWCFLWVGWIYFLKIYIFPSKQVFSFSCNDTEWKLVSFLLPSFISHLLLLWPGRKRSRPRVNCSLTAFPVLLRTEVLVLGRYFWSPSHQFFTEIILPLIFIPQMFPFPLKIGYLSVPLAA